MELLVAGLLLPPFSISSKGALSLHYIGEELVYKSSCNQGSTVKGKEGVGAGSCHLNTRGEITTVSSQRLACQKPLFE